MRVPYQISGTRFGNQVLWEKRIGGCVGCGNTDSFQHPPRTNLTNSLFHSVEKVTPNQSSRSSPLKTLALQR